MNDDCRTLIPRKHRQPDLIEPCMVRLPSVWSWKLEHHSSWWLSIDGFWRASAQEGVTLNQNTMSDSIINKIGTHSTDSTMTDDRWHLIMNIFNIYFSLNCSQVQIISIITRKPAESVGISVRHNVNLHRSSHDIGTTSKERTTCSTILVSKRATPCCIILQFSKRRRGRWRGICWAGGKKSAE